MCIITFILIRTGVVVGFVVFASVLFDSLNSIFRTIFKYCFYFFFVYRIGIENERKINVYRQIYTNLSVTEIFFS